jgi:ribonuclease P/MRP protein subunit RPP1
MPFHDLNIPYTSDHASLSHTLAFHAELGYMVVAIAISLPDKSGKLPATPPPVSITNLEIPKSITKVLTRATLTIADATNNHRLTQFSPTYNLLALRPTDEKTLQLCCTSLECDLISLDLSQRLGYPLKFKTVSSALQRGIRFEICYSPAIQSSGNSEARRNLISGAGQLIRATRGRGMILSSEARNALGVRAPYDVMNLTHIWGLGQERGKEALCEESAKVVRLAGMKRTSFRGVIDIVDDGAPKKQGTMATTNAKDAGKAQADKNNGVKRKASALSIPTAPNSTTQSSEEKPLSNREKKRRAKKAKLEARLNGNNTQEEAQAKDVQGEAGSKKPLPHSDSDFAIKHETLLSSTKKSGQS